MNIVMIALFIASPFLLIGLVVALARWIEFLWPDKPRIRYP
jgi:hypothetical protein